MKCNHCGAKVPENAKFCENCGMRMMAPQTQTERDDAAYPSALYGQPAPCESPEQPYPYNQPYPQPEDPCRGRKMKWYKFLVYFALIALAVICTCEAVLMFTTGNYDEKDLKGSEEQENSTVSVSFSVRLNPSNKELRDYIYTRAPGLKAADIVYGVMRAISVPMLVAAWAALLKKKRLGPLLLHLAYGFYSLSGAVRGFWAYTVGSDVLSDTVTVTSASSSLVVGFLLILLGVIYFNKRKDVFVN